MKNKITKEKKARQCLSLGQPLNKSPSSVFHFYGLKSQLTPVFPRQCTSQQVHSPQHLQKESLPTRITKTMS